MNESGIMPVGYRVLMEPDVIDEKTSGGIIIPDDAREKEHFKQQHGKMVAWGDGAFCTTEFSEEEREKLRQFGARVIMTKYGGKRMKGKDGRWYFMCNDKDITAMTDMEVKNQIGE